jgi:hypothetical protein
MALTRRFFTNLAANFREARPNTTPYSTEYAVWMHCVTITANALAVQNAMFNYAKFYEACGMPADAIERHAG